MDASDGDIVSRLGRRVKVLRTMQRLTQEQFAAHVGISRTYLSEIEHGKREICLRNLELIAIGLHTTPDELLRGL